MLLALYAAFLGLNAFWLLDSLYDGSLAWAGLHLLAVAACLAGMALEVRGSRS